MEERACFGTTLLTGADRGWSVDLLPIHEVKEIATYNAVVAGSAIDGRQWLPEAMAFVEANQAKLRRKPCAIFLVCMTLAMRNAEKHRPLVAEFQAPVRARVHPVSEAQFAGVLDLSKISSFWKPCRRSTHRFKYRLAYVVGGTCVLRFDNERGKGDHRHWEATEEPYSFSTPGQLMADFEADVRRWNDANGRT